MLIDPITHRRGHRDESLLRLQVLSRDGNRLAVKVLKVLRGLGEGGQLRHAQRGEVARVEEHNEIVAQVLVEGCLADLLVLDAKGIEMRSRVLDKSLAAELVVLELSVLVLSVAP